MSEDKDRDLEEIQEELVEEAKENQTKKKEKVSGRSVFEIEKIIKEKAEEKN